MNDDQKKTIPDYSGPTTPAPVRKPGTVSGRIVVIIILLLGLLIGLGHLLARN